MSNIDHELMESLEYKGDYGARYECRQCVNCPAGLSNDYFYCEKQGVSISGKNNVCRAFEARIKNPSAPDFNFDDYLEFLGSDYYRPYSIDKTIITGSARLNEVIADGGSLAEKFPKSYSSLFKYYDKPFCRIFMPRAHVEYGGRKFDIDYRRYRENMTIEDGAIHFDLMIWKETERSRKYKREICGTYKVGEFDGN